MMNSNVVYSKHVLEIRKLYRQSLKLVQDYSSEFGQMRKECLIVRQEFDQLKSETNPKKIQEFKTNKALYLLKNKHSQPYYYPTSPNGTKYQRNDPVPQKVIEEGQILVDEYNRDHVRYEKIK
ncbi:hypothetical protein HMI55_003104 [Coelomomyces lativittatus]|nr:hypothetical protein HMI55_003104 [Coelomomyces lativittatus]